MQIIKINLSSTFFEHSFIDSLIMSIMLLLKIYLKSIYSNNRCFSFCDQIEMYFLFKSAHVDGENSVQSSRLKLS